MRRFSFYNLEYSEAHAFCSKTNETNFTDIRTRIKKVQDRVDIDNASIADSSRDGSSAAQTEYNYALKRFLLGTEVTVMDMSEHHHEHSLDGVHARNLVEPPDGPSSSVFENSWAWPPLSLPLIPYELTQNGSKAVVEMSGDGSSAQPPIKSAFRSPTLQPAQIAGVRSNNVSPSNVQSFGMIYQETIETVESLGASPWKLTEEKAEQIAGRERTSPRIEPTGTAQSSEKMVTFDSKDQEVKDIKPSEKPKFDEKHPDKESLPMYNKKIGQKEPEDQPNLSKTVQQVSNQAISENKTTGDTRDKCEFGCLLQPLFRAFQVPEFDHSSYPHVYGFGAVVLTSPAQTQQHSNYVVAEANYCPEKDDELEFRRGDVIRRMDRGDKLRAETFWFVGCLGARLGWVRENLVRNCLFETDERQSYFRICIFKKYFLSENASMRILKSYGRSKKSAYPWR